MTASARPDPALLAIAQITVPKAAEILADRLRGMIMAQEIAPGQSLPTERDLSASSGLSRSSVREALQILDAEGLITKKVGRSGGSVVRLPDRDDIARPLQNFVRGRALQLSHLLECRQALEPYLAERAAVNRSEEELAEMQRLHRALEEQLDDVAAYKRLNLDWHLAVARASRNDILIALMEAIADPIYESYNYQHVTTPELRRQARDAHAAILEAITEKNPEKAKRRMEKHVIAYIDELNG